MSKPSVGWIGLGAMGQGMAQSLLSQGFKVKAYDVYAPSLEVAVKAGATPCATPAEAGDVDVLGLMVVNAVQVEDALFGAGQVAAALPQNAVILCFSTVPPSFLDTLRPRLEALGKNIGICDCPVSGGSTRAAAGTLVVMTSGSPSAVDRARPVLAALTQKPEGNLQVVGDTCGAASDFKMINQVLCTAQITMAGESMAFGRALGLNPRMLYNLIRQSSGNSFMFGHRGPWQLRPDGQLKSAMTICAKDAGIIMDEARLANFPAPLTSATEQVMVMAIAAGLSRVDDGCISLLWEKNFGGLPVAEKGTIEEEEEKAKLLDITPSETPKKVLFVGLGMMGAPMALAIQKAGINVVGADVALPAMDTYSQAGGKVASDMVQEAADADIVVLIPNTALQAETVLFGGNGGITAALPANATIILSSTVAPSDARLIQTQLDALNKGLTLVDAPVSGGPSRAANGDLAVMASGTEAALAKTATVLQALSTAQGNQNLFFVPGGLGTASAVKLVNNHLAGVHLAAAAEGFAFARKKDMNLKTVYDVLAGGAASTYVLIDRAPRMLAKDAPVHAHVDVFVKDLGIVLSEAKKSGCPLFLAAAAHQMFVRASAEGFGKEDDSSIVRLWERYGVYVKS